MVGGRELAPTGVAATRYGAPDQVGWFTINEDGRITGAGNVGIDVGLQNVYVKPANVGEGTQVCCDGLSDVLLSGHWASYVGHKNDWTIQHNGQCMSFYEGESRAQSGTVQLLCAAPRNAITGSTSSVTASSSGAGDAVDDPLLFGGARLQHVRGSSPSCPFGAFFMRKWAAAGWRVEIDPSPFSDTTWSEAICLGN